ncbi:MAG: outer membrane lipoprotein carrier protein LolA [bacterium]
MTQILPLLSLLSVGFSAPVTPAGTSWGRDWASIRKAAQRVKSVRAEFVQRKHMKILLRPLVSKGGFRFSSPASITWEYTSPIKSRLVMSKGSVTRYLWENGQFRADANSRTSAMQVVLAEVALWIKGHFLKSRTFSPVLKPGTPTVIQLTPKTAAIKQFIQRIDLTLDTRPGAIRQVTILEGARATTTMQFTNTKVTYR